MSENLNAYWVKWTGSPVQIAKLLSDCGIQWAVLGVLRQFYTFREKEVASKTAAGEYALASTQERWQPIIRKTLKVPESQNETYFHSRIVRAVDAVAFLKYIIWTCTSNLNQWQHTGETWSFRSAIHKH
jgi:Aminoglycoside adenylyltransferase, C-terminal domain